MLIVTAKEVNVWLRPEFLRIIVNNAARNAQEA
jgi:hypothetical protein